MNHRRFNSLMSAPNTSWVADSIGMKPNPKKGVDLIDYNDPNRIVEVKFNLQVEGGYTHKSWRVLEHQLSYGSGKEAYWALGFYILSKPIREIRQNEKNKLEILVKNREIYLVCWDWMFQFPAYRQSGETAISKWENTIRFPKFANLPSTIKTVHVKNGIIHLTENVPTAPFRLREITQCA